MFYRKSLQNTIYFKILYMDLMAPYLITNTSKILEESIPISFNIEYQTFLENTPKRLKLLKFLNFSSINNSSTCRVIANYLFWRMMQASLPFFDKDLRNIGKTLHV